MTPGSVPQAVNTPSPSQMTELSTTTLSTDKSPLANASSASSLTEPYPWIHSNSPKVSSNPASVGSIPMTSTTTSLSHGISEVSALPVAHISSPQSVPSPQRTNTTTSLYQSSQQSSFPLQSTTFNSSSNQFPATLNLSVHDTLGSLSNPIQITSPGADFHTTSTASTHSLASLMSPASTAITSDPAITSVTSPPFAFTSSLSSSMASQIDIASISSSLDPQSMASSVSNISSLLMSNSSSSVPPSSTQSVRPSLPSQTPTPPPPPTTQPQGAAAVAAQILMQATLQASKQGPGGLATSLPTGLPTGLPLPAAVSSTNTFPPNATSLTPSINPTMVVTPVTLGSGQNTGIETESIVYIIRDTFASLF